MHVTSPAWGQTAAPNVPIESAAPVDEAPEVEEVIVTGSRAANATISGLQVEPIRLPQNVRVIDDVLIEELGATRIADLFALSGVTQINTNGGTQDNYSIRGFSTVSGGLDILINRFSANRGFSAPRDVATVARFEVLKGPASALSGRGEPGGTVNIVTLAPRNTFHASGEASIATFDQYRAVGDVGGPIGSTTAVRFIAVSEDNGSFRDFGGNDRLLLAPSIAFEPTDRLRFLYQLEYSEYDAVFDRGVVSIDGDSLALPRERFLGEPGDGDVEQRSQQHQATATFDIRENVAIEAGVQYRQGSLQGFLSEPTFPTLLRPPNPLTPGARILERIFRERDFEFDDLSGRVEVSANGWLAGLTHQLRVGFDAFDFTSDQINAPSNGQNYGIDVFNPVYGRARPAQTRPRTEETLRGEAFYVQDLVEIGPDFTLLLGLRHDRIRQRVIATAPNGVATERTQEPDATSPRVALTYAPSDQFAVYASYGRSFLPNAGSSLGGAGNPLPLGAPFEPERGRGLEAGLKYELVDGQLNGTVSVFELIKENVLVAGGAFPGSVALGEARSRGVEADVNLRLGERVTATAYASYIDAEVTADTNPTLVGARLNNIPEFSAAGFVRWASAEDDPGSVSVAGGLTYIGDRPASLSTVANVASPSGPGVLPAYLTAQANVGYRVSERFSVQLDVRNIFDEYFVESSNNDSRIFPGAPRTVRLTLRAEY